MSIGLEGLRDADLNTERAGFRVGVSYVFERQVMVTTSDNRFISFHCGNRFLVVGFRNGESEDGVIVKIRCAFNPNYLYEVDAKNLIHCSAEVL